MRPALRDVPLNSLHGFFIGEAGDIRHSANYFIALTYRFFGAKMVIISPAYFLI